MPPIALILPIALVFFVAIPGIGAFAVRSRWRRFRRRVQEASLQPLLSYRAVRDLNREGLTEGRVYRFFGSLEAIQHDSALSLRGGDVTVAADMTHSEIYVMPRYSGELPDQPPVRTSWARLGSLIEGSKVFVSGELRSEGSRVLMGGDVANPLLVVLYDGPERDLLRRCIWCGRQLNEYWNQMTPGALAGGTLALITIAYVLLRSAAGQLPAMAALTLAAVPLLPFLPPGVVLFFAYRWSWRRGRILRAHRDILRLPLRHLDESGASGRLPDGQPYGFQYMSREEAMRVIAPGGHLVQPPVKLDPEAEYAVFGYPSPVGLTTPPDPMTEAAAIPGDPASLSALCQRRARSYELASGAILGAGLLINAGVVFVILQYLIR